MFCTTCLRAIQELRGVIQSSEDGIMLVHHMSAAELSASAQSGCRFCYTFWDQYSKSERQFLLHSDSVFPEPESTFPNVDDSSEDAFSRRATWMQSCLILVQLQRSERLGDNGLLGCHNFVMVLNSERNLVVNGTRKDMSWFVLQPLHEGSAEIPVGTEPMGFDPSSASPQAWSVAKKWIEDCLTSHKTCNQSNEERWYPSRLLDIQNIYQSIRLMETRHHNCLGPYMTLSHRWGQARNYSLRRSTYNHLLRGVPIAQLPQAFRDATIICQRLDVRYLWIDSLCIMQDEDDLSDWIKEATLMDRIYSNSHLNVSALAATDSSCSFFTVREPGNLAQTQIETAFDGVKIGSQTRRYRVVDLFLWEAEVAQAPLNLRAWVLQERLLAPRVLHFGHHQLLWECHELDAAESYPRGLPALMSVVANTGFKCLDPQRYRHRMTGLHGNDPPEMAPYRLWTRIVDSYTKCGLTNGEDKLIAMSGIAKRMRGLIQDEYVCGMWRKYLSAELLWQVDHGQKIGDKLPRRSAQYRAPSFSWASIDGVVQAGKPSEIGMLFHIVDVSIEPATNDDTGLIRGGSLLLQGQLQKIEMKERGFFAQGQEIPQSKFKNLHYIMLVNGVEARNQTGEEGERNGPLLALDEDEQYFNPVDREDLYCVPASTWGDGQWLDVLLLQLVDGQSGTYRRFGLAKTNESNDQEVLRAQASGDVVIPSLGMKDGQHIIRLI